MSKQKYVELLLLSLLLLSLLLQLLPLIEARNVDHGHETRNFDKLTETP